VQAPIRHAAQHRLAVRRRIIREVEDAIQRSSEDNDADTLHAEFLDRLDAPDLDDGLEGHPVADIIADICRDLGIAAPPGTHPWKHRTPEDIASLCARAGAPRAAAAAPILLRTMPPATRAGSDPPYSTDAAGALRPHGPTRFREK
jgi:hypothetical protein